MFFFPFAETLVVLGGNSGQDFLSSVEAVSLSGGDSKQCSPIQDLPNAIDGITPTNIGPVDSPVVCGGLSEGEVYRDECFVYQPYRNTWELLGKMMNTRTEYGIAQIDKDKFMVTGNKDMVLEYDEVMPIFIDGLSPHKFTRGLFLIIMWYTYFYCNKTIEQNYRLLKGEASYQGPSYEVF